MLTSNHGLTSWNGPICSVCDKGYLGIHKCKPDDLLAKAAVLINLANAPIPCSRIHLVEAPEDGFDW